MADYTDLYQGAGLAANVDPMLLRAIAQIESSEGRNVGPSSAGARGVMQFIPETAAHYGVNVNDPRSSIYGAGRYIDDLLQYYGGDLHAALSAYGGDSSGKHGYANSVLANYRALQKPATASPFLPGSVPGAENYLAGSNIDEIEKHVGEPLSSVPDTKAAATTDFKGSLFGGAPAAAPSETQTVPPADFKNGLFGAPPAPAQGAPAAPSTTPATTQASAPSPSPAAPAAPAADATTPSATPLVTPPEPSWWERNVAAPVRAMYNPTTGEPMNYLLQQPSLQAIGAGIFQGARNVAQRFNEFEQHADQAWPTLAAIDRSAGETPDVLAARGQRLQAQTAANRTQYGDSLPFTGGEIAGNLLATYPLAASTWALRGIANAVPLFRGATEVANMAGVPAAQNILTTPGQDWRTAGAEGAAGGLAVGGVLGSVANQFTRGALAPAIQDARDLGFKLSTGDERGGLAKWVEDYTKYFPGSGATRKAAEYRSVINDVLNRNMGMPGDTLTQATLQTARARAGQLMDQVRGFTVDANRDPQLLTQLGDIAHEAGQQPQTGTSITNMVDVIQNTAAKNGGVLPGNVMHDLIKQGTPLDRLTNSKDPVIKDFAHRIETALQDSVSRTGDPAIYGAQQAAANQQAVDAFNTGRYFWKTIKTVEPLVDKTGTADDATYSALARRIQGTVANPNFDPRFAGGNQDMQKLARVLNGPLEKLPESGTGRQLIIGNLLSGGGEGGLGLATHIFAPQNFGTYLQDVVAPTLAAIGGGRILRYGPGLGLAPVEAARQLFNPLLPRIAGPSIATNRLLAAPQPGQQQ